MKRKPSLVFFAMACAVLAASCMTDYPSVATQDQTYSATIQLPEGSDQFENYTRVVLWVSSKIGDPNYPGSDKDDAGTYSKVPYFETVRFPADGDGDITALLVFKYNGRDFFGSYDDHFSLVTIGVDENTCRIDFMVTFFDISKYRNDPDFQLSPATFVTKKKHIKEYKETWQSLTAELQRVLNTAPLSDDAIDALEEAGYTAFENEQYAAARDNFYKAALAEPYYLDLLTSYAYSLANNRFPVPAFLDYGDSLKRLRAYNLAYRMQQPTIQNELKAINILEYVHTLTPEDQTLQDNIDLLASVVDTDKQLLNYYGRGAASASATVMAEAREIQQRQLANLPNQIALTTSLFGGTSSTGGAPTAGATASSASSGRGTSGRTQASYQTQYDTFARRVEGDLRTLANMSSASRFNAAKSTLKANQRDMKRIRQEAQRAGFTINARSDLENANPTFTPSPSSAPNYTYGS